MATGSSGSPSTSSRALAESFALPSNFLPCYLFWLVVCHDSDNHHDGSMGMKTLGNMLN
jgi:hypothetical protein